MQIMHTGSQSVMINVKDVINYRAHILLSDVLGKLEGDSRTVYPTFVAQVLSNYSDYPSYSNRG